MCLGASNVSFGLPERHVLNAAFLPMAMAAGLTSAIMSTAPVCVQAVRASDLLLGHDPWGASWISAHRARQAAAAQEQATAAREPTAAKDLAAAKEPAQEQAVGR
jgi:5-methyltetrahydrofolate--homocysteine methyltransferase